MSFSMDAEISSVPVDADEELLITAAISWDVTRLKCMTLAVCGNSLAALLRSSGVRGRACAPETTDA